MTLVQSSGTGNTEKLLTVLYTFIKFHEFMHAAVVSDPFYQLFVIMNLAFQITAAVCE